MFQSTDCMLCLGRRGSGKSHLAKVVQSVFPRVIVFDTLGEYNDGEIVRDFDQLTNKLINLKKENNSRFKLIFKFEPELINSEEIFNEALRIIYYFGKCLIVIEEVQLFSSPHYLPHWLKQCLLTGRHQELALLFTTQRPGELNKTILSQCNHIFAGQLHEKNDLNYISTFLGINSQKLISIEPRKFIYFNPGNSISIVDNELKTKVQI